MTANQDRLYDLLPVIHKLRDAERGYPLRSVMRVASKQVQDIEDNIHQLYENWFIETAEDWAVPYIAELIGYHPVTDAGIAPDGSSALAKVLTPRREVANTLAFRQHKGTLALLELIADAAAAWPARAVEFFTLLAWSQNLNHLKLGRPATASFRSTQRLSAAGGPFDTLAHSVDVRRINSRHSQGRYSIPNVGLFVWRLKSYSITHAPACCVESIARNCFSFSVLGNDTPLFNRPQKQIEPTAIAQKLNLPIKIDRRDLEQRSAQRPHVNHASGDYYGLDKSLAVFALGSRAANQDGYIPPENIAIVDLSRWQARPPLGRIALDPVLGRFMFPLRDTKVKDVWVNYHYGFSANIGGGEYPREMWQPRKFTIYPVARGSADPKIFPTITAALSRWKEDKTALTAEPATDSAEHIEWLKKKEELHSAVIEITDNQAYTERLAITLGAQEYLQIRAANRKRPVIRLLDQVADRPDSFTVRGETASRFVLDGLLISGNCLRIIGPAADGEEADGKGDLCDVTLRHCTLVPGWLLDCYCKPKEPKKPSIEIEDCTGKLRIEHSIIGAIHVTANERTHDPAAIFVSDSIVDATSDKLPALMAPGGLIAFAELTVARSTVIGGVKTHAIALAENSIFLHQVIVARRQLGCIRYCYIPRESRTPRRYRCQPDLVRFVASKSEIDDETARVVPRFTSLRYGNPGYCQVNEACALEIKRGADDESEMGVFHNLFESQREAILRARLNEYTPADMNAGIIFVS